MTYTLKTEKSWAATTRDLEEEFRLWGVREWDTNYPRGARLEGFNQTLSDKTVILTYTKNGRNCRLEMGKQLRAVDNLRVLFLAIQSIRMNEKRGIGEVLQSAYKQLAGETVFDPYEILGVSSSSPIEVIEAAFRALAKKYHPDQGGSADKFKEVSQAIEQIRKDLAV